MTYRPSHMGVGNPGYMMVGDHIMFDLDFSKDGVHKKQKLPLKICRKIIN